MYIFMVALTFKSLKINHNDPKHIQIENNNMANKFKRQLLLHKDYFYNEWSLSWLKFAPKDIPENRHLAELLRYVLRNILQIYIQL